MKYHEILKINDNFSSLLLHKKKYNIHLISNIVINQLGDILEYHVRVNDIPGEVSVGKFDNIIQESFKSKNFNLIIIFMEISNYINNFHFKIDMLSKDEVSKIEKKIICDIDIIFENLKTSSLVLFNKFSFSTFENSSNKKSKLEELVDRLNSYLKKKISNNFHIIDIDKIFLNLSIRNSIDMRLYYSYKTLYTVDFYNAYSEFVLPYIKAVNGKKKKALILDCDNTLWGGIIGEDGIDKINLSPNDLTGKIFNEIQSLILSLKSQGVLLCLCSKNNLSDVDQVLKEHPDMVIKDSDLVIKKVNWNNKVKNLKEISDELNIGLDSMVFIDDSDFEINLVKQELPEIKTIKVPSVLHKYPAIIRKARALFFDISKSPEDKLKTEMYKQQNMRKIALKNSENIENYLSSLGLKVKIFIDDKRHIARMSQMTQKTNQFNFTTIRYTEADINRFVIEKNYKVVCFSVSDCFGDSGITGLCILKLEKNNVAIIDTFLMSCRIIGRNIEYIIIENIVNILKKENYSIIKATYKKTLKNNQISNFYEKCNFELKQNKLNYKNYDLNIKNFRAKKIDYIGVSFEN